MMRREVPGVLSARYRSPQCRGGRAISAAGTGMCCVVRQEAVAGASSVTRDAAACGVEVFRRVVRQEAVAGASSVRSDAAACGADAVRQQAFRERCGARRVVLQEAVAGASSVTRDAAACGADAVRRVVRQEAVAGASSCGAGAVRRRALGDSVAGVTLVTRWGMGLVWALGPVPGAELTR